MFIVKHRATGALAALLIAALGAVSLGQSPAAGCESAPAAPRALTAALGAAAGPEHRPLPGSP